MILAAVRMSSQTARKIIFIYQKKICELKAKLLIDSQPAALLHYIIVKLKHVWWRIIGWVILVAGMFN